MTRREIEWPAYEPIPNTLEEALANGWEILGSDIDSQPEDTLQTGEVILKKCVGRLELHLSVPYVARYTFDRPGAPWAIEDKPFYELGDELGQKDC